MAFHPCHAGSTVPARMTREERAPHPQSLAALATGVIGTLTSPASATARRGGPQLTGTLEALDEQPSHAKIDRPRSGRGGPGARPPCRREAATAAERQARAEQEGQTPGRARFKRGPRTAKRTRRARGGAGACTPASSCPSPGSYVSTAYRAAAPVVLRQPLRRRLPRPVRLHRRLRGPRHRRGEPGWGRRLRNNVVIRMHDGTYTVRPPRLRHRGRPAGLVAPGQQIGVSGSTGDSTGPPPPLRGTLRARTTAPTSTRGLPAGEASASDAVPSAVRGRAPAHQQPGASSSPGRQPPGLTHPGRGRVPPFGPAAGALCLPSPSPAGWASSTPPPPAARPSPLPQPGAADDSRRSGPSVARLLSAVRVRFTTVFGEKVAIEYDGASEKNSALP